MFESKLETSCKGVGFFFGGILLDVPKKSNLTISFVFMNIYLKNLVIQKQTILTKLLKLAIYFEIPFNPNLILYL